MYCSRQWDKIISASVFIFFGVHLHSTLTDCQKSMAEVGGGSFSGAHCQGRQLSIPTSPLYLSLRDCNQAPCSGN